MDGDQPVVVMAAKMFGFVLNGNSVNGVGCEYFWGSLRLGVWDLKFGI